MLFLLRHPSAMLCLMAALFCLSLPATVADYTLDDPPTDIKISPWDGSVFVSAGTTLIFLNANLTENSTIRIIGGHIAHAYDDTNIFMACTDADCRIYYIYWRDGEVYDEQYVIRESVSTTLVSVQLGNQFYVGSTDNEAIKLSQFVPYSSDPLTREFDRNIVNENVFYRRQFLYAFESEDYVYFLVRDNGTDDLTTNLRVVRVCQEESGTNSHFTAVYESVLECGDFSASSQVTISDSVVAMERVGNATITIAVTTNSKTNICIFSISDINIEMDTSYRECVNVSNSEKQIPLVWYSERTCGHFSVGSSESCDFDLFNNPQEVPALATFDKVVGKNILQFNESDEITAILAFKVDSTDLLLVAYSRNGEHYLAKYHIRSSTDVQLVSEEEVEQPIVLLRWNELWEQMYGATMDRVFDIPLEDCSNFTTCSSCTSSADPVCGWCILENTCSRQIDCHLGSELGHWVQDEQQCIASISLDPPSIAVDYMRNVELTINPPTAALPSSPPGEYMCSFYNENLDYNITTPLVGDECQIPPTGIPSFTGTHIDLEFVLTTDDMPTDHVLGTSLLTLYNCTQLSTCGECVEASTSCGWCVYDHICTGNSSNCQHEQGWRSLPNTNREDGMSVMASYAVCPTVLTSVHGVYTHPVTVGRDLNLSTLNMPPEIGGFHYRCRLMYSNNQTVDLNSTYHNETVISCKVPESQVRLSSDVDNGWETTHLDLLWIRESDGYAISFNTQTVNIYDCMELGSDCSSCFSANLDSGFECIWCDYTFVDDECSVAENCLSMATLIKNTSGCPNPFIESITPVSGPTEGGTMLTISGYNLGAIATNVTVELVNIANNEVVPCDVHKEKYKPGIQIVCITQRGSEGGYSVRVQDQREYTKPTSPLSGDTFHYVVIFVNEIVPLQGPKAGGTEIVLTGTGLGIGSPGEQRVSIENVECIVRSVKAEEIRCISQGTLSAGLRRIRVRIDDARIETYEFNYTENPVFTNVHPRSIIPAGGITLTFRGNYLNTVLKPELSLTVNNNNYTSLCRPKSSSVLKCIAPRLSAVTFVSEHRTRRNSNNISYTIVMDGADGPSSTDKNLKLELKPNPVFTIIHEEDRTYLINSKITIRIMGMNIDSVLEDEITVVINEDECTLAEISATQILCWPPDTTEPGDKEVKVIIASNALNYSVGFLRYRTASVSSSGGTTDIIVIILPVVAGVVILLLTCLAALIGCVGVGIRRRRARKASERVHTFGQQNKELQMMSVNPNVYNRRRGGGSHDYDTIPDVLAEMQQVACNASEGMDFTIAPTRNSNLYSSEDEGKGSSTSSHSRPNSSSTSGSVSNKFTKNAPLPALPVSTSDEYVAMGSYSVSDTVSPAEKGHAAVHYADIAHQKSTEAVSTTAAPTGKEQALGDAPFRGVRLNGTEEMDLKATEENTASQESSA